MAVPAWSAITGKRQHEQPAKQSLTAAEADPSRDPGGADCKGERGEQLVEGDEVVVARERHRRQRTELAAGRVGVVAQVEDPVEIRNPAVLPPQRCTHEVEGEDVVLDLRHPDPHRGAVGETKAHDNSKGDEQRIAPQWTQGEAPVDPATEAAGEKNRQRAESGESAQHRRRREATEEREPECHQQQLGMRNDERSDEKGRW